MNIDDRQNEVELHGLINMQRTKAIYDQTLGRIHPDNTAELAAQGALIPAALEAKMQALAHGQVHKQRTVADEMRELLGITTNQSSEVGVRKHGDMENTSASRYAQLIEAVKELMAQSEEANAMTNFDMDDDDELDMDENLGASVRSSAMQSEIDFLRAELKKAQKESSAKQAMKESRFSSRGGTQTNRFGIGA